MRALLEIAGRLTTDVAGDHRDDVQAMLRVAFTETAIHDVVQVTAYFNYVHRLGEGLGVELEPRWDPR